jgi:hypothetical protein
VTASSNVLFDAVGAGKSSGVSFVTSISWSHTATAGAYVVVAALIGGSGTTTATYGGTAMTLLGSIGSNNVPGNGVTYLFGLASAPSGAQTVLVSFPSQNAVGNSVSYKNVASVGTPATAFGASTSHSQAMTCTTGQVIIHAYGSFYTFTSPAGGTSRYSGGTNSDEGLLIQDATASATFTATTSAAGNWGGIGVVLH